MPRPKTYLAVARRGNRVISKKARLKIRTITHYVFVCPVCGFDMTCDTDGWWCRECLRKKGGPTVYSLIK